MAATSGVHAALVHHCFGAKDDPEQQPVLVDLRRNALEPIASMPVDTLVAAYAPTVQRYLTGDID